MSQPTIEERIAQYLLTLKRVLEAHGEQPVITTIHLTPHVPVPATTPTKE